MSDENNADIHRLHTANRLDGGRTVCCWEDDLDRNDRVLLQTVPLSEPQITLAADTLSSQASRK